MYDWRSEEDEGVLVVHVPDITDKERSRQAKPKESYLSD